MPTLNMDVPEKVFSALRIGPDEFKREMRITAAASWYEQGKVSQEVAARIAGLSRTDFLLALVKMGKNSFQIDYDDLDKELARG
jgi:predicted HTH domain antitoxin